MIRPRPLLITAIASCLVVGAGIFYVVATAGSGHVNVHANVHAPAQTNSPTQILAAGTFIAGKPICGQPILKSPYSYDGRPGGYPSGTPGLPTYGTSASDFPDDTAGDVLPRGHHSYASFQLRPNTVYYLLPGTHVGTFMADTDDAFVGGLNHGISSVLTDNYSGDGWAIDSDSSNGNQPGVTIEYLTIEKYQPGGNEAAVNQEANTNWTIQYDTITLNVPGAGIIAGTGNVLSDNCLTLNGQYGFQSVNTDGFGTDSLTGGAYDVTVKDNEISYNDTCDFEGPQNNSQIGWKNYNPVPLRYRNPQCGSVVPDGDEGGFKLWQSDGVTIEGNYIHNNWGPGAWADTDNANTTFADNAIVDNDDEGIVEEISYNFSISDNYLADNGRVGGLSNSAFPTPAIYISESGSNTSLGGVPACPAVACANQPSYVSQSMIVGNTLVNNAGSVFLWQNSDRFCGDSWDGDCTLVKHGRPGPFTLAGCKSNLRSASFDAATYAGRRTGSPAADWWDGCLWRTENVLVAHNFIDFNPADIKDCNKTDWPACGAGGVFSNSGSPPDKVKWWVVSTDLTFFQGNTWSDNVYNGPSTFYAWTQGNGGNPVSWAQWTGALSRGDKCSSPGSRSSSSCTGPFGQDAGSKYSGTPTFSLP
jgi:hypothetical protein